MNIKNSLKKFDNQRLSIKKGIVKVLPFYLFIPLVAFLSNISGAPIGLTVILAAFTAAFVSAYHYGQVGMPFEDLSTEVRRKLISQYMSTYHPMIKHKYFRKNVHARSFIKDTNLINPNDFHEEDVITGTYKNVNFYISEIDLKKKANKSSVRLFKGMLFHLKIPGRSFPKSRIQSKLGMLKKVFGGFLENERYGFQYETDNLEDFQKILGPLFPFIKHLMKQQGDLRIETKNDEILILLESKVKFLDEPKQGINKSFNDQVYYANMVKQLNSFLYIVEAFTNELEPSEIEDGLELRMLEMLKNEERRLG